MPSIPHSPERKFILMLLALPVLFLFGSCGGDDDNPVIDTTAPTVISVSPASGDIGVSTSTTVTVTFSEVVNASTINESTFIVNGGKVGTISATGNLATFTPDIPFEAGTVCSAVIRTGVTDVAGNGLESDFAWSFTTEM